MKGTGSWKGRNFLFTLNDIDHWDELKEYVTGLDTFNYGIATLEKAPTTGHKHIHFYAQMKNPCTLSKKEIPWVRIDKCRGSAQQNIDYIKKVKEPEKRGEIIFEEGTPKHKGGPTVKELREIPKEQREELPGCYINIVNKLNAEEAKDIPIDSMHKNVKVYYIWGPSGIGKTERAKKMFKEAGFTTINLVKFDGNFWAGTKEQEGAALYDDFRDSHMKPSEFINFIDYNIQLMNVKGGGHKNLYTYIIITSVQDPKEIYKNVEGEPRKQWLRRFTEIIHMDSLH